jgi:hypothetical protein
LSFIFKAISIAIYIHPSKGITIRIIYSDLTAPSACSLQEGLSHETSSNTSSASWNGSDYLKSRSITFIITVLVPTQQPDLAPKLFKEFLGHALMISLTAACQMRCWHLDLQLCCDEGPAQPVDAATMCTRETASALMLFIQDEI